ncbi:MAG: hypothetical protein CMF48_07025 [Legionellales bacterium]|nr:hypothetical protein [Legionellales bacterium]|tara:strand:+ start:1883 stop:2428 length:546 start_codon:yes stop_codon:yes gene_type:complete
MTIQYKKSLLPTTLLLSAALFAGAASADIASKASDTAITGEVTANLVGGKYVPYKDVKVSTKDNVVYLSGTVDTTLEYQDIIQLALDADGDIAEVNTDNFTVKKSSDLLQDIFISMKLRNKILAAAFKNDISSSKNVHLETTDGKVFVTGQVKNKEDIKKIGQIIEDTKGVKNIDNRLGVA